MKREIALMDDRFPSLLGLQRNWINRLFDAEEGWFGNDWFSPRTNVAETEERFEVTVELPGMKRDDFHVEVVDGRLEISGEVKEGKEEKNKTWHRVERRHGGFKRVLSLPENVDADKIDAEYKDGLLNLRIPKMVKETPAPKRIEVKASATEG